MSATSGYPIEKIISRRCLELAQVGSEIRRVFMLGQDFLVRNPGADLIDLSLGNPDLEPPAEVRTALLDVLSNKQLGLHRYTDNAGLPEVRQFLSNELTKSEGIPVTADSIYLTCGAAGALQVVLRALIDVDDEVIIFAPFFCEYVPYSMQMGGKPVVVSGDARHFPNLEKFEAALTEKTKLVIVNSPNNPSGVVYPREFLQQICDILNRHRQKTGRIVHLVSDEPYSRLVFNNVEVPAILKMYDFAWIVRSHSKDLGLAGERIGFLFWGPALARPEILGAIRNAGRAVGFVNAPALMQRILPAVYHCSVEISKYRERVETFVKILREGGIDCIMPDGSFFVFPKSPIADDREFCKRLIEKGVLCVAGTGFGAPGYFRAAMTKPLSVLIEAAKRIVQCER